MGGQALASLTTVRASAGQLLRLLEALVELRQGTAWEPSGQERQALDSALARLAPVLPLPRLTRLLLLRGELSGGSAAPLTLGLAAQVNRAVLLMGSAHTATAEALLGPAADAPHLPAVDGLRPAPADIAAVLLSLEPELAEAAPSLLALPASQARLTAAQAAREALLLCDILEVAIQAQHPASAASSALEAAAAAATASLEEERDGAGHSFSRGSLGSVDALEEGSLDVDLIFMRLTNCLARADDALWHDAHFLSR